MSRLAARLKNTARHTWYLGFTSFGGPPVHYKIFYDKFVAQLGWIDETLYHELFGVCQTVPGPASTKLLYCINLHHDGPVAAVLGFLLWSLPGALAMYALSLGVARIEETLPRAVYALLSGINSATVGVVALAAVQLSQRAITDPLTRVIVFVSASAVMLYNAIWYIPVLMAAAAVATVVNDFRWLHGPVRRTARLMQALRRKLSRTVQSRPPDARDASPEGMAEAQQPPQQQQQQNQDGLLLRNVGRPATSQDTPEPAADESQAPRVVPADRYMDSMSWKTGVAVLGGFLLSFVAVLLLRGLLARKPLLYSFFANMYLAGTIIFGGGPVVIPLLREYVVAEGWVQPRDFLIGLAIIQAFPGPNFNFAVYLGSLTARNGGHSAAAGAVIGFVGIFAPGLIIIHGLMGLWSVVRGWRWVKAASRGVNAAAVGLIYAAVYRLWQIGYIDEGYRSGTSLSVEPWWVVATATSFVGGMWFQISPPAAILIGGIMGMIWYGVVAS